MPGPLPTDRPFTTAEAAAAGVGRTRLRQLVDRCVLRHPLHGVYVPAGWPDTPLTRARAAAAVLPAHCVVSDRSAAWLHGIDVLEPTERDVVPRLEVVSRGGSGPTRRPGVLGGKRDLLAGEVTHVGEVAVTTPLRTACDVACLRGRLRAIAALDAFRTRFDLTEGHLARMLPRFAGRRGVRQLRELVPLSRTGVDSPPESWVRLIIHDEGLPMPAAQVWTWVPGWGRARLENAYEHLRIAVEYDGEEFHSAPDDVERDLVRREALQDAGWVVVVVRKDGFSDPGRSGWLAELATAYAGRAPYAPVRRLYARGPDESPPRRRRRRA